MKYRKIRAEEIYLTGYGLYVAFMVYNRSSFHNSIIRLLLIGSSLSFVALSFIISHWRLTQKNILKILCFVLVLMTAGILSRNITLIVSLLLLVSSRNVDFNKIITTLMYTGFICVILIYMCYFAGILPDTIYSSSSHNYGFKIHTYGFNYYSFAPSILTYSILYYIHKKRESVSYLDLITVTILSYLIYMYSTLRLSLCVAVFTVFFILLSYKFKIIEFKNKFWRWTASGMYLFGFITSLIRMMCYDVSNKFWVIANQILSGRIAFEYHAYNMYGISLLGQEVVMYGNVEKALNPYLSDAFYIDCGYAYALIVNGIIFSILILIIYTHLFRKAYKLNDKTLYIWCWAMAFASMSNNYIISVISNPLIFLAYKSFLNEYKINIFSKPNVISKLIRSKQ